MLQTVLQRLQIADITEAHHAVESKTILILKTFVINKIQCTFMHFCETRIMLLPVIFVFLSFYFLGNFWFTQYISVTYFLNNQYDITHFYNLFKL